MSVWEWAQMIRKYLMGRGLNRAVERHKAAAEGLDAAVKEMLRR